MNAEDEKEAYNAAFMEATQALRERAGFTQEEIATVLRMQQDKYKQYESRTPLPHYLVTAFCLACRVEPSRLYNDADKALAKRRRTSAA